MKHQIILFLLLAGMGMAQTPTAYQPITSDERWKEYAKDSFASPGAYFSALGPAIGAQLNNKPTAWGQGVQGYARRTGYYFAMNLMDNSIHHTSAAMLGNDVRYDPSKKKGVLPRVGHALSRGFVTRNRNGNLTLNASNFMGSYGAGMLSTYMLPTANYEPLKYGVRQGHALFAANTGSNLLKEFAPEIKKIFRRK